MIKNNWVSILTILVITALFLWWQLKAYRTPQPLYQTISKEGCCELRQYPAMIVAEVHMKGDRVPAIRSGFRVLAHYIFGSNQAQQKISMTAPVIQQASKIPMSAPVLQQKEKGEWIIRFIMPSTFTLNTLPKAKDSAIKLVEIPSKKYAVIRFSGSNTNENLKEHEDLLDQFLLKNHLKALAQPLYAFYNPPWILPLFRRNEIMIEINN